MKSVSFDGKYTNSLIVNVTGFDHNHVTKMPQKYYKLSVVFCFIKLQPGQNISQCKWLPLHYRNRVIRDMMRQALLLLLIMLFSRCALSQSVINPNYGLKSPVTAGITRVDFSDEATIVWLTVTSDINNAWFCIDRNTFLVTPRGVKLRQTGLKGLPYCPATHKFRRPGETASFSLTFPATGVLPWFSVVEECAGGCLSFRGIVTDAALNSRLDQAYALASQSGSMAAYRIYEEIINEIDTLNLGIEGSIYTNLILLDRSMGRPETARSWYNRMMTADTPDLGLYLENLRREGVSY